MTIGITVCAVAVTAALEDIYVYGESSSFHVLDQIEEAASVAKRIAAVSYVGIDVVSYSSGLSYPGNIWSPNLAGHGVASQVGLLAACVAKDVRSAS